MQKLAEQKKMLEELFESKLQCMNRMSASNVHTIVICYSLVFFCTYKTD